MKEKAMKDSFRYINSSQSSIFVDDYRLRASYVCECPLIKKAIFVINNKYTLVDTTDDNSIL